MATDVQTRVLSTPAVYVTGRIVKIVPNSLRQKIPGENNVRAMSAGGGTVEIVYGINAEKLIGEVSFEVANTAENAEMIRSWRNNSNNGVTETVRIVEKTAQYAYDTMVLANEPEQEFKSDGNIKCEFRGRHIP
jgi:hypothetical protein